MNQISQNWDFFFCQIEGSPASIRVNLGLYEVAPIQDFSKSIRFLVKMQNPTAEGLSSNEEYPVLCDIEDALFEVLASKNALMAGSVKCDGFLEFWVYAQNTDGLEADFGVMMKKSFANYKSGYQEFDDSEWDTYFNFLYPDAFSMQSIMNRKLYRQLQEQGDDETVAREIDHWLYFSSQEDALAFCEKAKSLVYSILSERKLDEHPDDTHPYQVHITRQDTPSLDTMDDVVWELMEVVAPLNGIYDGWGCNIVKS
ncbi:DUF695 domain-containing protein [Capnocytophaga sp.]|uniref:DUF695 domain-containing protein n=1 Tax=Capnocytophaga sp. TaxID=44737 RepID=UPI0026DC2733|nr:DUF695 domain-containing protein [Capnocytophaga sp.]MDO5105934.1 DUF695 domain-containing protein [Capnocytophaga sp.]